MAVSGEGAIGLLWYDDRDARPSVQPSPSASSPLQVEVRFAWSADGGTTWHQERVAGPFDFHTARLAQEGDFVGDYVGLVGLPKGFAAVYPMAKPLSRVGATDLYFSRLPG